MREILFRGKKVADGKWVEGFYHNVLTLESPASVRMVRHHHIYTQDFDFFVESQTVGQFTGLCDKNGKKGFTDDIVKAKSNVTGKCGIYCLVFDETRLHYGFRTTRHGYFYNLDEMLEEELGDCIEFEIIGNIHDNPELLEKG